MAFCRQCGNQLTPGARFCRSCGAALTVSSQSVQTPQTENSSVSTPPEPQAASPTSSSGSTNVSPTSQRRVAPATAGIAALVVLIAAGAYFIGSRSRPAEDTTNPENVIAEASGDVAGEGSEESSEGALSEEDMRKSCQSNLKQIALAVKQYAQDYD